jgi:hypothetical protein
VVPQWASVGCLHTIPMSSVKYGGVSSNSATVEATKFAGPYKSHEKPSSQFLGLIVMSHSLGEV